MVWGSSCSVYHTVCLLGYCTYSYQAVVYFWRQMSCFLTCYMYLTSIVAPYFAEFYCLNVTFGYFNQQWYYTYYLSVV